MKKLFRSRGMNARSALTESQRTEFSGRIMKNLFSLKEFSEAKTVSFFIGIKTEVRTRKMIQEALKQGKKVVVPVVTDFRECRMIFTEIKKLEELKETDFGLIEPSGKPAEFPLNEINIVLVPGTAFDLKGNRTGYGKGFYDRVYVKEPEECGRASFIGLAFEAQVFDEIPAEKHDMKMDKIVTEKRIIKCRELH